MDIADILVVILCYSSIVLSMKMSPCEKWSRTGITAAGTGVASSLDNKLNLPSSISTHNETNTLYVFDEYNSRIQAFVLGQLPLKGYTAASALKSATRIYVDDDEGPKIYVLYFDFKQVEK